MKKHLVSINDLPPDGKNFELDDQDVWLEPIKEFKMDCRITEPLKMKAFIMPVDGGCLLRGEISGAVVVPCNRCAEDADIAIRSAFDEFEEIPESHVPGARHQNGDGHIVFERNAPMLDLAEAAWEQFMLALPSNPLCRTDCKGLCAQCGVNLNLGQCDCEAENMDDRMAPLRNLAVRKQ